MNPRKCSFHNPAARIPPQSPPIVGGRTRPVAPVGRDQLKAGIAKLFPQRIRVIGTLADQRHAVCNLERCWDAGNRRTGQQIECGGFK